MADVRTLARRYARALLDVAREQDKIDEVEEELHALADLWEATPELRTVIAHPAFPRSRKSEIVRAALEGKVSDLVLRFVDLLIEKGRLGLVAEIAGEFDEASDCAQGIAKARVAAFMPLTGAQRSKLEEKLRAFTARPTIEIEESQDPSLLGGIVVRIGDQVLDGSIAGRLRRLRERLLLREDERAQQAATMAAEALRG